MRVLLVWQYRARVPRETDWPTVSDWSTMSSGISGYKTPFLGGSAVLSRVPCYRQVGIWQRGRLHRRKGVAEHRAERMSGQITVQQQGASATPTHPGQSEIENRNYRTEITGQDRHATPSAPFGQGDPAGSCLSRGSIAYLHTVPLLAHTWPLHGVAAWGSCTGQRDSFNRRIGGGRVHGLRHPGNSTITGQKLQDRTDIQLPRTLLMVS